MDKKLTFKQRILAVATLFGMFFGPASLIFPVHLGQLAGSNVIPATIGFIITAVGIPILGVAAIAITHANGLQALANHIGKGYSYFFTCLLYLAIGPFFAIPRCATISFTTGIVPMLGGNRETQALLIFSTILYAIVLFCSLHPSGIKVWIGKIITPLFLLFFAILVITALLKPSTSISSVAPADAYKTGALFFGFVEGYNTMDGIAGLAFGIVVMDLFRGMGIRKDTAITKAVLYSGSLAGALMALLYVLTIIMGTQSRGLFELSDNGSIALAQISGHYLGKLGSIVLALTITFACLKTSIGLVTSCAEAFRRMFPNGPSYKAWAVIFTAISFIITNFGLSSVLAYSLPALMFLYPLTITLILLALFGKFFDHDKAVYISVTAFTCTASLIDLLKTLPAALQDALHLDGILALAPKIFPLFSLNLGWILPAVIGFVIGLSIHTLRKHRSP
jgi:LIVCS family branched-chain amino acid:cation transporter